MHEPVAMFVALMAHQAFSILLGIRHRFELLAPRAADDIRFHVETPSHRGDAPRRKPARIVHRECDYAGFPAKEP
jgi:hypothetical protein